MASLQALPFELVDGIVRSFCLHCCPPSRVRCTCSHSGCVAINSPHCDSSQYHSNGSLTIAHKTNSQALGALSRTSRRLHDAAARTLYHRPNTKKWWLLARTLINRPDLAQHVKELCFPEGLDMPEGESDVPPEVLAYRNAQRRAYAASLPEGERGEFASEATANALFTEEDSEQAISLLTSLCRGAETIEAVVGYGNYFPYCAPGSLPALHTVELAHCDTEYGISLYQLQPLLKAAPNLRALRCRSVSEDEYEEDLGVTLDRVTVVDFQCSAIHASALRAVLQACPRVETFLYSAGGATTGFEQFNPSEARDLLLEHCQNLKTVVLDLRFVDGGAEWDEWDEWDEEEKGEAVDAFKERGVDFQIEWKPSASMPYEMAVDV